MRRALTPDRLKMLMKAEAKRSLREARDPYVDLVLEDIATDVSKAFAGGPAAVRSYVDSSDDKSNLKRHLNRNADDKDVISVGSPAKKSVGELRASQSEIDLMKSVAFPLGGFKQLKEMITSNTTGAPGAITISGDLVLDGHHRWSGVLGICGPGGEILVQDLGFPGSDADKLAASQLAIAAYKKPGQKMPAAADPIPYNILGAGADKIKQMILDNVGKQTDKKAPGPLLNDEMVEECSKDKVVADWAGFEVGADAEAVKEAIATKVGGNLAQLQKGDAPARADMPQFDDKSIGGSSAKDAIYKKIAAGELNIEPPFKKGATSGKDKGEKDEKEEPSAKNDSYARSGTVMIERWQRLAGIIKG